MRKRTTPPRGAVTGLALLLAAAPPAHAGLLDWDGSTGNWADAGRWLPTGTEPMPSDKLTIDAGMVTVDQPDEFAKELIVGDTGDATLRVLSGGTLETYEAFLANGPGSTGQAIVSGQGASWTVESFSRRFTIGLWGAGTLLVEDGGAMNSASASIGSVEAGSSGSATITGAGSVWTNAARLYMENDATLLIENGGKLASEEVRVGGATSPNTRATVTGVGSSMQLEADLQVLTTLDIQAGAVVSSRTCEIGLSIGPQARVTVTGSGTRFDHAVMKVGYNGQGLLRVEDGAAMTSVTAQIGARPGGQGEVVVTGNATTWTLSTALYIGEIGTGKLTIQDGAVVTLQSDFPNRNAGSTIGEDAGASGEVLVTGTGSAWNMDGNLFVGGDADANLRIEAGGLVTSRSALMAWTEGVTAHATVTGNGSRWATAQDLVIGGELGAAPGVATLTVQDGATVQVGRSLRLRAGSTLTLQDASLEADTFDHRAGGTFDFQGGTLRLNQFQGTLEQDGGRLASLEPGFVDITDDYRLNAGELAIRIGAISPGSGHDRLRIGGALRFGPTSRIDIQLINEFMPRAGDVFDLLDFAELDSAPGEIVLPDLGTALRWDDSQLLVDGTLQVTASIPGDTDLDGDIDDNDLGILFANYTGPLAAGVGTMTAADGDTDGDGDIDDADLGNAFARYTGPLAGANVPEPAGFALAAGLGGLVVGRRRRH
jgi:T5SS/PEP-CTERM-associated repeat protein